MDARPVLFRIARLPAEHGLEAVLIGNAAAALQGARAMSRALGYWRKPCMKKRVARKAKLEALKKEIDLALRDQIRR